MRGTEPGSPTSPGNGLRMWHPCTPFPHPLNPLQPSSPCPPSPAATPPDPSIPTPSVSVPLLDHTSPPCPQPLCSPATQCPVPAHANPDAPRSHCRPPVRSPSQLPTCPQAPHGPPCTPSPLAPALPLSPGSPAGKMRRGCRASLGRDPQGRGLATPAWSGHMGEAEPYRGGPWDPVLHPCRGAQRGQEGLSHPRGQQVQGGQGEDRKSVV